MNKLSLIVSDISPCYHVTHKNQGIGFDLTATDGLYFVTERCMLVDIEDPLRESSNHWVFRSDIFSVRGPVENTKDLKEFLNAFTAVCDSEISKSVCEMIDEENSSSM